MDRTPYIGKPRGGGLQVGDIRLSATPLPSPEFEVAATPPATPYDLASYPGLLAKFGARIRNFVPHPSNAGPRFGRRFNGAMWGIGYNDGKIYRRPPPVNSSAWVLAYTGSALRSVWAWGGMSRLFFLVTPEDGSYYLHIVTADTGGLLSAQSLPKALNSIAEGGGYFVAAANNSLYRSTTGASSSWASGTGTGVSTPNWLKVIRIGTQFLAFANGQVAVSNDNGATWTVTAVPSLNLHYRTYSGATEGQVVYHAPSGKLFALGSDGGVRSCLASNPTGTWTLELSGLDVKGTLSTVSYGPMFVAPGGMWASKAGAGAWAKIADTSPWPANPWAFDQTCEEWGDGLIVMDSHGQTSGTKAVCYAWADMLTKFDRPALIDPGVAGLTAYLKVK